MYKPSQHKISFALALLGMGAMPSAAMAQAGKASVPQFAFANAAWSKVADDLEPIPGGGPGPVISDKAHPYVPNGRVIQGGGAVTVRVADLNNPILKPWATESMKKANDLALAGKEAYEARASCQPGGVPGFLVMGRLNPMYIVQTPKEVALINEGGPEVRHIYLDVAHSANLKPSPYGESVGHYEGDTLVVDTAGLSDDTYIDNYRTPHTTQEKVTEQFKLIDDGKELQVDIHVEDPGAFNMPWSARQVYRKGIPPESLDGELLEAICAENNEISLDKATVTAIPKASKPDF